MNFLKNKLEQFEFIDFHTHHPSPDGVLTLSSLELDEFSESIKIERQSDFFSVGLHPWVKRANKTDFSVLGEVLSRPEVLAFGECGLDRLRGDEIGRQIDCFKEGIAVAKGKVKAVILHCVRAFPELIAIKKQVGGDLNFLVHAYNANLTIFQQLVANDFMFSLGQKSLQRSELIEYIRENPTLLSRIGLETDDADINIKELYQSAACAFGIKIEELQTITKNNFQNLIGCV